MNIRFWTVAALFFLGFRPLYGQADLTSGVPVATGTSGFLYTCTAFPSRCVIWLGTYRITVPRGATAFVVSIATTSGISQSVYGRVGQSPELSSGQIVSDFNTSSTTTLNFPLGLAQDTTYYLRVATFIQVSQTVGTSGQLTVNVQSNTVSSVGGTVRDLGGNPVSGVTLTLGGGASATAQTSAQGTYTFPSLATGLAYTVTPSKAGCAFTPPSRSYTFLAVNQPAEDYVTSCVALPPPPSYSFIPVAPCRVVDTRSGQGRTGSFGPPTPAAGSTREVPVPLGGCGVPASAKAYSLNFTAIPKVNLSYLTTWPAGVPQPLVSTLNSFHGGVVANAAIVPAGTNGAIDFYVTDAADVVIDINGYFDVSTTQGALDFYPVTPCRLSDSRVGSGFAGLFGPPSLAGGVSRSYPLLSANCSVPPAAQAYSLNATVVPSVALAYLTLFPAGGARPLVSTLNSFDGATVANAAIVPGGNGGAIEAYVTNSTDLIFDINGYFAPGGGASLKYTPVTPCRIADTRTTGSSILAADSSRVFAVSGLCGVPSGAQAYSLNVTVVPTGSLAYLTLWPTGLARPLVSTLNSFPGRVVANAALVPAGAGGAVSVFVTNDTHVVLDINGYFAP